MAKTAVITVLIVLLANATVGIAKPTQPNIVLIVADDLDADEVNCTMNMADVWATPSGAQRVLGKAVKTGIPKVLTPNIDSLGKEGVLFTRFYVNATVCTSSRYCLLTGRYASRGRENLKRAPAGTHLTLGWHPAILREESSLPKVLQQNGYRTGIIGKWHNMPDGVMPSRNNKAHAANATFEKTQLFEKEIKDYYQAGVDYLREGFGWDVVDRMEWGNSIVNLDWQCAGALEFIEKSKDQPFFLYCALPVPHGQYSFKYNDISTFDRRVTSNGVLDEPLRVLPSSADVFRRVSKNGIPRQNAMATRMDDYVGAILGKLDELGKRKDTLVIFTSDHGSRGKNSCYEGGARVPLLASWPAKIRPSTQCDSLCGNVDIAATLIEIAGAKPPADMSEDSRSLVSQLMGQPDPAGWRDSMLIEAGNTKAVVTRQWKYVANRVTPETEREMKARPGEVYWTGVDHHNYSTDKMYPHFWDADQLYSLNDDLYEQTNLANSPKHAAQIKRMRQALKSIVCTLPHTFGEFSEE